MGRKRVRQAWWVPMVLSIVLSCVFCSVAWGDDPNEPNPGPFNEPQGEVTPSFDPNNYSFLIYDPHNDFSSDIQSAVRELGITSYDVRSTGNAVTVSDLATHDILIVGWNYEGSTAGLDPNIIEAGITGRILVTGHDADYHATRGPIAAKIFLSQAIGWVLQSTGTGLVVLADPSEAFDWLPSGWAITAVGELAEENVESFTSEASVSGVYNGLSPKNGPAGYNMSGWSYSYHNVFSQWGSEFVPFELGGQSEQDVITIARSNAYGIDLSKVDDVNDFCCRDLYEQITYTISYHYSYSASAPTFYDVTLTDFMPKGVDYDSSSPNGSWDILNHKVVWTIPTLAPGDSGTVYLTVTVNELSEPTGQLKNKAVLSEGSTDLAMGLEKTKVCCWGDGIIYVDKDAVGANTGTSWYNAYTDLQSALARAAKGCGSEIWVARGSYSPGTEPTDTFTLPAGVSVYGGFAGYETSITQRNIKANPTILTGDTGVLDNGVPVRNITVVTMGNNTLLDGFIVEEAKDTGQGIYGKDITFIVSFCVIEDNQQYGIYAENSNTTINWCIIQNNNNDGIYHEGNNTKTITLENCRVENNIGNGINAKQSIPILRNNQIAFNGSDGTGYYGLNLFYPKTGYDIRNNTVIYNANEGIYVTEPNTPLTIRNCILWGNRENSKQLSGSVVARYSLVYDPNYPNQTTPDATTHNISCDPKFAYDGNPNIVIYHLMNDSPCIDKGDPALSYTNQSDLDNETRLMGNYADMGADEIDPSCNTVYNSYDTNADGLVNLSEYLPLARAWLSHDPNDPAVSDPNNPLYQQYNDPNSPYYVSPTDKANWNPNCNHDDYGASQYVINLADLTTWIEDSPWLWKACWLNLQYMQQQNMMSMSMPAAESLVQSNILKSNPVSMDTAIVKVEKPKKSVQQQVTELEVAARWLEELWLTDLEARQTIDKKSWNEFMKSVYESLDELKTITTKQPILEAEVLQ